MDASFAPPMEHSIAATELRQRHACEPKRLSFSAFSPLDSL